MSERKSLSLAEHKEEVDLALSMGYPEKLVDNVLQILRVKWSSMPEFELKESEAVVYSDLAKPEDMTHPVMWFKDSFGRMGLLSRIKYNDGTRSVFSTVQQYCGKPWFVSWECSDPQYSQQLARFCRAQNHSTRCEQCKPLNYHSDVYLGLWKALAQNQTRGLSFVCLD